MNTGTPGQVKHELSRDVWEDGENTYSLSNKSILICTKDGERGGMVFIDKDESIDMAKKILLRHRIPFCNRVSNGH